MIIGAHNAEFLRCSNRQHPWGEEEERNAVVKYRLEALITEALKVAQASGDLPAFEPPPVILEHPKESERGDFATPVAMQSARLAHKPPLQIAQAILKHLPGSDIVGRAEACPPGFINVTLDDRWLSRQVDVILNAGDRLGASDLGQGRRTQVEFVSVNPTGPLHIGSARNAVLGDSLARVLEAAGYDVQREYYINDRGTQFENFAVTAYVRYAQALGLDESMPEDGYRGQYMVEMGEQFAQDHGRRFLEMPREGAIAEVGELALKQTIDGLGDDLALIGVRYDCWFSERTLYQDDTFKEVMALLRRDGFIEEKEGAIWFTATKLGAEKDEVLVRSDGVPGYFASDIAYHYNKFVTRGFEWVIDVWGADHQGHVPRMREMMRALGLDPSRLTLLLYQLVTLKRGGEIVRLSKRTGDMITLREVVEEVGPDAVRFFLLSRSAESQMDFDLEVAKEQSNENPVYYVQYAHARIASILRKAAHIDYSYADSSQLTHPMELALIRQMLKLQEVIEMSALRLAPHHLTYYATEMAGAFHAFYRDCRVVSSEPGDEEITRARLKLVSAMKVTLARVLSLMGMSAPESM
jgi:arginyl-tRNA synthetase